MNREITGYHVLLGFVAAFSIIIGVNVLLAVQAIRTFPGLEVKNSYVASQSFDRERTAQQALGWTAHARIADGNLWLSLTAPDGPARARIVEAKLGRASHVAADRMLKMDRIGADWVAPLPGLEGGVWHLWLVAEADDGTIFRQRLDLWAGE